MGKMMKGYWSRFRLALFAFLNLNLILFISPSFAQYFTINKSHSDITISEDSSFIVKETIEVTFHQPRHGIYREIPFEYRDEIGKILRTPTKVLSVTDASGRGWKYNVSRQGPILHIRIGDAKNM
jgi:hypothetical protein